MKDESNAYVIGARMARAARAQLERVARRLSGSGPVSPELCYDRWAGDNDLADPVPRAADSALRDVCRRFAAAGAKTRAEQTAASSMDDFYTLRRFAMRSAVFAMREKRPELVVDGLVAVAMIDPRRIDERDAHAPLALLEHAARAIGAQAEPLMSAAAQLAGPDMRELIITFSQRRDRGVREWGYAVVETAGGTGFVDTDYEKYEPALPLDRIALSLADVIGTDSYERGRVTIATDMPRYWLSGVDDAALGRALRSVRAGATIHAGLRPGVAPDGDHASRSIIGFLLELDDDAPAESLLGIARAASAIPSDIALLGVREGPLFCLIVARSFVQGVPPVETSESLQRFDPPVAEVLRSYSSAG